VIKLLKLMFLYLYIDRRVGPGTGFLFRPDRECSTTFSQEEEEKETSRGFYDISMRKLGGGWDALRWEDEVDVDKVI